MAARKRSPFDREHVLAEVARRYNRRKTQAQIAAALGVTRQQVGYDLKVLRRRWRAEAHEAYDELSAAEFARIAELEATFWQAWEESKKPKETVTTSKRADGQVIATVRMETRYGDLTALAGVLGCSDARVALLGLDHPVVDVTSLVRKAAQSAGVDPDEAVREAERILAEEAKRPR
jgi:transcriptional regulator with XRE-family HTH domain